MLHPWASGTGRQCHRANLLCGSACLQQMQWMHTAAPLPLPCTMPLNFCKLHCRDIRLARSANHAVLECPLPGLLAGTAESLHDPAPACGAASRPACPSTACPSTACPAQHAPAQHAPAQHALALPPLLALCLRGVHLVACPTSSTAPLALQLPLHNGWLHAPLCAHTGELVHS